MRADPWLTSGGFDATIEAVNLGDLQRLPLAGLAFELDGTLLAMNPAAERLLGGSEAGGHAVAALRAGWAELVDEARARGNASRSLAHGSRVFDVTFAVRDDDVVLALATDVTPYRVASELEAQHRLESLGLLAGGIARHVNNQLVSVLAGISRARDDANLSDSTREALRWIEAAAERMAQLDDQLLAYAGRARVAAERIDGDELVVRARDQIARLCRDGVTLEVVPGARASAIEADRSLLGQVLANLVANASEAMPGGGTVRVTTRRVSRAGGSWWQLEVSDEGTGMDAPTLARIFDPFFTTKPDRHGLGLSAVHGIVRQLGGTVEVESRPGQGARFRVSLAVADGRP